MERKKAATFRLPVETIQQIESIAKRNKISQADVISVLVHCLSKRDDCIDEGEINEIFDIIRLG